MNNSCLRYAFPITLIRYLLVNTWVLSCVLILTFCFCVVSCKIVLTLYYVHCTSIFHNIVHYTLHYTWKSKMCSTLTLSIHNTYTLYIVQLRGKLTNNFKLSAAKQLSLHFMYCCIKIQHFLLIFSINFQRR